jgi:hypothetical protein
MSVNLQAWSNFLGRSLIVFLMIEGVKTFPWVARVSGGSISFKLLENVAVNFVFAILVQKTGSDIFLGEGPWPLVLSVVFGSLATAGLHRLKIAFERRSPSDPAWEAKHARSVA